MNSQQAHIISTIQTLFRNDERLIYFFFHHKRAELRLKSCDLQDEAKALGREEYHLIQAALDFWNGDGRLYLCDALTSLDDENMLALIRAILHSREINADVIWDETSC